MLQKHTAIVVIALLSTLLACGDESESSSSADAMVSNTDMMVSPDMGSNVMIEVTEGCDPLQPDVCAFPWPSSYYLTADETTATGFRLTFGDSSLPASLVSGEHMNPKPFRRYDGFGLGSQMYTLVRNLDASDLPDETNIAKSVESNSPIMLLEVSEQGVRQVACWTEMDAGETNPEVRALFINPAEVLKPNHQYIVVMRNLRTLDGESVALSPALQLLRDGQTEGTPLESRQQHFDRLFEHTETAGIARDDIQVMWDFHTASETSLHSPVLSLWNMRLRSLVKMVLN